MHQHPRPQALSATPAASEQPQTGFTRSNSQRDRRPQSTQTSGSEDDFAPTRSEPDTTASMHRLNQVIQNFHSKAVLIILHSRAELSPAYSSRTDEKRVNKWFNIELDETEDYREDIRLWKELNILVERPPPLIIETYLSTDPLSQGQRLVILDDDQKRWDVYNALEPKRASHSTSSRPEKSREILLERWTIELGSPNGPIPADLAALLPHTYKRSIVVFRALYTYCNFLPAWKLMRKIGRSRSTMGMKLNYRIVAGNKLDSIPRADNLTTPLYENTAPTTTEYSFGSTESPAGAFSVQVQYRNNCEFRVDDSEELLSSRFIGAEYDNSRPVSRDQTQDAAQRIGSLPNDQRRSLLERPELGHAYGSLSTFHQAGIDPSTSPISALRAQKQFGDSPSPQRPPPQQAQISRPITQRSTTTITARRSSFSIQPFKTPTLAASPLGSSPLSASPRVSTRAVPTLGSLEEEPHQDTRISASGRTAYTDTVAPSSVSSSPKPVPVQRFQSSFSHRRNRLSVDRTANKTDDDQTSSGKASAASSTQPGSGLMTEAGRESSSGSLHADDDNISDFLKMLDQKKDLLNPTSSIAVENSARRTAAALSKFHKMRESNAALSESMSSSLMLQKPPAGPSRQTSSTSPKGKAASPHTQHVPFAPSRLSAAYSHDDQPDLRKNLEEDSNASTRDHIDNPSNTIENAGAIDIPTSPSISKQGYTRSSSVQRRRQPSEDDIGDLYGMKSHSMGAHARELNEEFQPLDLTNPSSNTEGTSRRRKIDANSDSESGKSASLTAYKAKFNQGRTQRDDMHRSSPHGSLSSAGGIGGSSEKAGSGSQSSWGRRPTLARPEMKSGDDDETMPFIMDQSDIGKLG